MGHVFSLVLSREITDEESVVLQESGCYGASFGTDSLPTNAEVSVTKVDIDDTVSPSLAEAIESALEAVKKVPDLGVPGLTVPALPVEKRTKPGVVDGEVIEEVTEVVEEVTSVRNKDVPSAASEDVSSEASAKKPGTRQARARKPSTRKTAAKKPASGNATAGAAADDPRESVEAATAAD